MMMNLVDQVRAKIDQKTKPLGSLGVLEDLALQIALLQDTLSPSINKPHVIVFAADHGIAATGLVNPYPQEVTAQMVMNFLAEGAAINIFTRHNQVGLSLVDAGVNFDFPIDSGLINKKIAYGTRNYLEQDAMSPEQMEIAMLYGSELVRSLQSEGCNCIGFGEMGIGNTSSASLIMSAALGLDLEICTGRGTGSDDEQLKIKKETLSRVYQNRKLSTLKDQPKRILQAVGGFEIAMMCGAYIEAKKLGMIILVDGFITTASLLIASLMVPTVIENCIFSHLSQEPGHRKMLEYFHAKPVLDLNLRLGEGTGCALCVPVLRNAVAFFNEMASFSSAGVSQKI